MTYTVQSCPPEVTNCPLGHVTTETISAYTTVCPANAYPTPTVEPEVIGILITVFVDVTIAVDVNGQEGSERKYI